MNFLARTSKRPSKCPQEQLKETLVQRFQIFQFLFGYWAKTFGRLSKLSRRVFERAFNMWKKICGKFFTLGSPMNINFFSFSASGFCSNVETYLAKFSKLPSTCPKEHMENNVFSKNFWRWAIDIHHFAKSLSAGLLKVDFTCLRKILRKQEFQKKKKSVLFVHWAKKIGVSRKTFSANFSKILTPSEKNWAFSRNDFSGLSKLYSTCPKRHLLKIFFLEVVTVIKFGSWARKT